MPAPTPSNSPFDLLPEPPFPSVILLGCQPNLLPPPRVAAGPCRVCGGAIRPEHPRYYCGQCDGMSPVNEARCRGARIGLKSRSAAVAAAAQLRNELRRAARRATFSELDRRRMWNGYKGSTAYALAEAALGPVAAHYRAFLAEIGEVPDFTLILDRRGNVVGRYAAAEPAAAGA